MPKEKPISVSVLRKELDRHGEKIKNEIRTEIRENGEKIKNELGTEIVEQENKLERHLDSVYGDFEKKQAFMAENILSIRSKLENVGNMVAKNTEDIEMVKIDVGLIRNELKTKISREELAHDILAIKS